MLLLFFYGQQGAAYLPVIDTGTYSQHPVNCIMAGNVPFKLMPRSAIPAQWLK